MQNQVVVREVPIEEAVRVSSTIVEFDEVYQRDYFESRYKDKQKLIIVAYVDDQPAGYIVGYDEYHDGSFYCWMAGVDPKFRKRGVLKALMDYEDNWARKNGYNKIRIKTRNNRREMLSYLVRYGFSFIEVEPYPNIADNRIHLVKNL